MARRKDGNALTNNLIDSAGSHVTKRLPGLSCVAAFATVPPGPPPFSSMNSMPATSNTVRIFALAPFHLTGRRYSPGRRSHGSARAQLLAKRASHVPQAARSCLTLMSDSARMPSPSCSRQIILSVSERFRVRCPWLLPSYTLCVDPIVLPVRADKPDIRPDRDN